MSPLDDRERLALIVKALRYCSEVVTRPVLVRQFWYETGREPAAHDLDLALRQLGRNEQRATDAESPAAPAPSRAERLRQAVAARPAERCRRQLRGAR